MKTRRLRDVPGERTALVIDALDEREHIASMTVYASRLGVACLHLSIDDAKWVIATLRAILAQRDETTV